MLLAIVFNILLIICNMCAFIDYTILFEFRPHCSRKKSAHETFPSTTMLWGSSGKRFTFPDYLHLSAYGLIMRKRAMLVGIDLPSPETKPPLPT